METGTDNRGATPYSPLHKSSTPKCDGVSATPYLQESSPGSCYDESFQSMNHSFSSNSCPSASPEDYLQTAGHLHSQSFNDSTGIGCSSSAYPETDHHYRHSPFDSISTPNSRKTASLSDVSWRRPGNSITLPCKLVLDFVDAFLDWQDLPFPCIERSLFVKDFLSGRAEHCSPALVRALCCLACRALGGYETTKSTYATLGNRFFDEADFLLRQDLRAESCAADSQAFGLLALHQLSVGEFAEAREFGDKGLSCIGRLDISPECETQTGIDDLSSHPSRTRALFSAVSLARYV